MTKFLPLLLVPWLAAGTPLHATETPPDTEALESGALRQSGFDAGVEKVVAPLEWNPFGLFVRISINGKPVKLMVDTGSSYTVLSPETAKRVETGKNMAGKFLSAAGDYVDATRGMTSEIRIGQAWTHAEPVGVAKLPREMSEYMDGVLGVATLRDWDVRLDVSGRTMTLFPAGKADRLEDETPVALDLLPGNEAKGNNPTKFRACALLALPFINGKVIPVELDTGYNGALDLPATLAEKAVPGILARAQKPIGGLSVSGLAQDKLAHFPSVRFGPDTFECVEGSISAYREGNPNNYRGTLGFDILRHYVMTFQFSEGQLRLKPDRTPWKPHAESTRGFVLTPDFKIFMETAGPARKAGLEPGDQVLAIDGRDMKSMTMEAISALDELPAGTTLRVRYTRDGGEPKEVAVVLEKE